MLDRPGSAKPSNLGEQGRNHIIGVLTQHAFLGGLEPYLSRGRDDRAVLAAGSRMPEKMDPHVMLSSKLVENAFSVPRVDLKYCPAKSLWHGAHETFVNFRTQSC